MTRKKHANLLIFNFKHLTKLVNFRIPSCQNTNDVLWFSYQEM